MDYALQVKNLCKDYGAFALKNVSFDLPRGSIMGFIGENGAGKTTTIKLILHMIHKDSGEVRVLGKDHLTAEREIKQQIGVVLDECHFHENLRPDNISAMMDSFFETWDDALFQKTLKKFDVPWNSTVKKMSRGMKTKLSLAAALAHRPQLLILDETTGGLDPVVRSEILDIFLDIIQDEDKAILLSTHITSDLEKIADYITLIHNGQLMFSQSADTLKYSYGVLRCGTEDFSRIDKAELIGYRKGQFGYEALVADKNKITYPNLSIDPASIEDIMLFYGRRQEK